MTQTDVAKPRPKTRVRILDACKELFNERGPMAVTTAEIAAAVGIQEGNLYYHFNRKEQILEALFTEFDAALRIAVIADVGRSEKPHRYGAYLNDCFAMMWEWRFFYRDTVNIFSLAPALAPRIGALIDDIQQQIRRVLDSMVSDGILSGSPKQLDQLVVNALIIATYWMDYLRSRRGIMSVKREHVDWGASQVMSLYLPFLTAKGHALFNTGLNPAQHFAAIPSNTLFEKK
jgi:AcrR family transcriptional regulator